MKEGSEYENLVFAHPWTNTIGNLKDCFLVLVKSTIIV